MSNFKIGQRVVCIHLKDCGIVPIHINEIYNVEKIVEDEDGIWICLFEDSFYQYESHHFRPLDESFAEETEERIAKMVEEDELVEV